MTEFDPTLPLEEAYALPSSYYTEDKVYNREVDSIFRNTWQAVGRVDQLPEAGNYFTVNVAGEPIVVTRGEDMEIRAFSNVCRHRAAEVMHGCGKASRMRCPYHGWTYDLTGKLKGVPEFDGVKNFCREENGLPEFRVETFGQLIFVNMGPGGSNLIAFLHPLASLPDVKFAARKEYEIACNWKVFVDNYLDGGYHVNYIHPELASVVDYKNYRTELHENCNVQIAPLEAGNNVRTGTAEYWWIFPNLMINIYDGVMDTNHVFPLGKDRCLVWMDFYFGKDKDQEYIDKSIQVADKIQAEDVDICESVQRGLQSKLYNAGRFSVKRENGGYQFHQMIQRWL
jgi:choline monooxygenase